MTITDMIERLRVRMERLKRAGKLPEMFSYGEMLNALNEAQRRVFRELREELKTEFLNASTAVSPTDAVLSLSSLSPAPFMGASGIRLIEVTDGKPVAKISEAEWRKAKRSDLEFSREAAVWRITGTNEITFDGLWDTDTVDVEYFAAPADMALADLGASVDVDCELVSEAHDVVLKLAESILCEDSGEDDLAVNKELRAMQKLHELNESTYSSDAVKYAGDRNDTSAGDPELNITTRIAGY